MEPERLPLSVSVRRGRIPCQRHLCPLLQSLRPPPKTSGSLSLSLHFCLSVCWFESLRIWVAHLGSLTEALAMDCEMVGVSFEGNKSALGRVTLVNTWGNVVYDEYVRPIEYVVDFRTKISGIRPRNLKKAKEFSTAQKKVAEAIKGRILVGHALHNDLKVLLLSHPRKDTRDTAEYEPFLREGRRRALRDLAAEILGVKIQQKEHCSIEDARAAMFIYNKHKKEWEKSIMKQSRFNKKHKNKHRKKSMPEQTPKAL